MQLSRYINLCYAIIAIILSVIFGKAIAAIMLAADLARHDTGILGEQLKVSGLIGAVIGVGITIYLYVNPKVQTWSQEVAVELSKVTWPGWEETKYNTLVVIVFSAVISSILATFDFFWKWLTDLILL
ncbi:MAG: preprotein translocase subunit SecE [Myxococcales bacterium]|nr:preprotein translocase subunit SecE [Myxococcales bacterium]